MKLVHISDIHNHPEPISWGSTRLKFSANVWDYVEQ